jgi:hypothetical protein
MNIQQIRFLREVNVTVAPDPETAGMEFSYESGAEGVPHFVDVPVADVPLARALYVAWGGSLLEGYPFGTTVSPCEGLV